MRELDEHELVLLFSTPPEHKGLAAVVAEVLTEAVATYRPRVVVRGGERGVEMIGPSLVVAPGRLGDGHYAVANIRAREAQLEQLGAPPARPHAMAVRLNESGYAHARKPWRSAGPSRTTATTGASTKPSPEENRFIEEHGWTEYGR